MNTGAGAVASQFVSRPCCFVESTYHRWFATKLAGTSETQFRQYQRLKMFFRLNRAGLVPACNKNHNLVELIVISCLVSLIIVQRLDEQFGNISCFDITALRSKAVLEHGQTERTGHNDLFRAALDDLIHTARTDTTIRCIVKPHSSTPRATASRVALSTRQFDGRFGRRKRQLDQFSGWFTHVVNACKVARIMIGQLPGGVSDRFVNLQLACRDQLVEIL